MMLAMLCYIYLYIDIYTHVYTFTMCLGGIHSQLLGSAIPWLPAGLRRFQGPTLQKNPATGEWEPVQWARQGSGAVTVLVT